MHTKTNYKFETEQMDYIKIEHVECNVFRVVEFGVKPNGYKFVMEIFEGSPKEILAHYLNDEREFDFGERHGDVDYGRAIVTSSRIRKVLEQSFNVSF